MDHTQISIICDTQIYINNHITEVFTTYKGITKHELAEQRMMTMLGEMLMVDIDTLDVDRPLTSYGVDSMMSTDIAGKGSRWRVME